jgi:hypothetical protein
MSIEKQPTSFWTLPAAYALVLRRTPLPLCCVACLINITHVLCDSIAGDFGVATILHKSEDVAMTHIGTPAYMAPVRHADGRGRGTEERRYGFCLNVG